MTLPLNYHRDWQRTRAKQDPVWYEERKKHRTQQRRNKKKNYVDKLGGKCYDCKGVFHPSVYDFHHLDETTKDPKLGRSTNQILMLSDKNIEKELIKCVLLCANCHRLRHIISEW